ncbi:sigma factor-like helix-turn-helix DNA-binding protein, partial [Streptomyces sp. Lzd4kr]|nr:sigma factor-like helix-turn-helix DNA-binding protein [Streptomyces sp. Lzd4kr]
PDITADGRGERLLLGGGRRVGRSGGDVGDALRCLAPELRQVLQAMVLDGLSVRETAVLLGLPEGTVKTRARRARSAMRRALA